MQAQFWYETVTERDGKEKRKVEIKQENWKIHKYVEITQHVPEQPMSKREIKKYLVRSENGNTTYQN